MRDTTPDLFAAENEKRMDASTPLAERLRPRTLDDVYFDSRGEGFGAEVKRRIMEMSEQADWKGLWTCSGKRTLRLI